MELVPRITDEEYDNFTELMSRTNTIFFHHKKGLLEFFDGDEVLATMTTISFFNRVKEVYRPTQQTPRSATRPSQKITWESYLKEFGFKEAATEYTLTRNKNKVIAG